MAYVYVYSPINSSAISLSCYCSENRCGTGNCPVNTPCGCSACTHPNVAGGYCCPLDISAATGTLIKFRGNSLVESIQIEYFTGVCGSETGDINNGIKVHMFRKPNAECEMGAILYAHLKNRESYVQPWQIINKPSGSNLVQNLGITPAKPAGSNCYRGTHVHLEVQGGSRKSFSQCGSSVSTSTWIYNWYWNEGWCP